MSGFGGDITSITYSRPWRAKSSQSFISNWLQVMLTSQRESKILEDSIYKVFAYPLPPCNNKVVKIRLALIRARRVQIHFYHFCLNSLRKLGTMELSFSFSLFLLADKGDLCSTLNGYYSSHLFQYQSKNKGRELMILPTLPTGW